MAKTAGKLKSLSGIVDSFAEEFRHDLKTCGGLIKLLFLPNTNVLVPLVQEAANHFSIERNAFVINEQVLGITLEDVLFLTHLRIAGEPVLIKEYTNDAYNTIFKDPPAEKAPTLNMNYFSRIAETATDRNVQKVALLMMIIRSFIMPSSNIDCLYAPMVSLLEYDKYDNYAWGAAILAFLLFGLNKYKTPRVAAPNEASVNRTHLEGSPWLLTCFFLVRIPRLWDAIGVSRSDMPNDICPLNWILGAIKKKSFNHRNYPAMRDKIRGVLDHLTDADIEWQPYLHMSLPNNLKPDLPFVTRVSPIFCFNYVVLHKPHKFSKQFGIDPPDESLYGELEYAIKHKDNRGGSHNYLKTYKKELELWYKKTCLLEGVAFSDYADIFYAHHSPHMPSSSTSPTLQMDTTHQTSPSPTPPRDSAPPQGSSSPLYTSAATRQTAPSPTSLCNIGRRAGVRKRGRSEPSSSTKCRGHFDKAPIRLVYTRRKTTSKKHTGGENIVVALKDRIN